jgi:hypothetical protein
MKIWLSQPNEKTGRRHIVVDMDRDDIQHLPAALAPMPASAGTHVPSPQGGLLDAAHM